MARRIARRLGIRPEDASRFIAAYHDELVKSMLTGSKNAGTFTMQGVGRWSVKRTGGHICPLNGAISPVHHKLIFNGVRYRIPEAEDETES